MNTPIIFTPDEVAAMMKVSVKEVLNELEGGTLRGFRFAGQWRTTEDYLNERVGSQDLIKQGVDTTRELERRGATNQATEWEIPTLEQLRSIQWNAIGAFDHQRPELRGKPLVPEHFDEGYRVVIMRNGVEVVFIIGFCRRDAAGLVGRGRAVVFRVGPRGTKYPVVEFVGANDYDVTGNMGSIILSGGRRSVRPDEVVPAHYGDMPLGLYHEIVAGPRARHSRCVVAHRTDFPVMLRHALLREIIN